MGLILKSIEDPRGNLEKARHMELFKFAQANGVTEIVHQMPADLMRKILRSRGLTNIAIPHRVLGQPEPRGHKPIPQANGQRKAEPTAREVNAEDELLRQFMEQQRKAQEPPAKPANKRDVWNAMRKEAKAKGIHLDRKDNFATVAEKLKAHDGQNAA